MNQENQIAVTFLQDARHRLLEEHWPKIKKCLHDLSEADIWWRPNPNCNSVGNLVLHLSGNLRQWMIHGLGGATDVRNRPAEFAEQGPIPKADLEETLESTLREVDEVLAQFDPARMLEPINIQNYDVNPLFAIFHITEHFALHMGQITYITKMRMNADLGFYKFDKNGRRIPGKTQF